MLARAFAVAAVFAAISTLPAEQAEAQVTTNCQPTGDVCPGHPVDRVYGSDEEATEVQCRAQGWCVETEGNSCRCLIGIKDGAGTHSAEKCEIINGTGTNACKYYFGDQGEHIPQKTTDNASHKFVAKCSGGNVPANFVDGSTACAPPPRPSAAELNARRCAHAGWQNDNGHTCRFGQARLVDDSDNSEDDKCALTSAGSGPNCADVFGNAHFYPAKSGTGAGQTFRHNCQNNKEQTRDFASCECPFNTGGANCAPLVPMTPLELKDQCARTPGWRQISTADSRNRVDNGLRGAARVFYGSCGVGGTGLNDSRLRIRNHYAGQGRSAEGGDMNTANTCGFVSSGQRGVLCQEIWGARLQDMPHNPTTLRFAYNCPLNSSPVPDSLECACDPGFAEQGDINRLGINQAGDKCVAAPEAVAANVYAPDCDALNRETIADDPRNCGPCKSDTLVARDRGDGTVPRYSQFKQRCVPNADCDALNRRHYYDRGGLFCSEQCTDKSAATPSRPFDYPLFNPPTPNVVTEACVDSNECEARPGQSRADHSCDESTGATCVNTVGGYRCDCPAGTDLRGVCGTGSGGGIQFCAGLGSPRFQNFICADRDECAMGTHTCAQNEQCTNRSPGFICCPAGKVGVPDSDSNVCVNPDHSAAAKNCERRGWDVSADGGGCAVPVSRGGLSANNSDHCDFASGGQNSCDAVFPMIEMDGESVPDFPRRGGYSGGHYVFNCAGANAFPSGRSDRNQTECGCDDFHRKNDSGECVATANFRNICEGAGWQSRDGNLPSCSFGGFAGANNPGVAIVDHRNGGTATTHRGSNARCLYGNFAILTGIPGPCTALFPEVTVAAQFPTLNAGVQVLAAVGRQEIHVRCAGGFYSGPLNNYASCHPESDNCDALNRERMDANTCGQCKSGFNELNQPEVPGLTKQCVANRACQNTDAGARYNAADDSCECGASGYIGELCAQPANECDDEGAGNVCAANAVCNDRNPGEGLNNEGYDCACPARHLDVYGDGTACRVQCVNGTPNADATACECDDGHSGQFCDEVPNGQAACRARGWATQIGDGSLFTDCRFIGRNLVNFQDRTKSTDTCSFSTRPANSNGVACEKVFGRSYNFPRAHEIVNNTMYYNCPANSRPAPFYSDCVCDSGWTMNDATRQCEGGSCGAGMSPTSGNDNATGACVPTEHLSAANDCEAKGWRIIAGGGGCEIGNARNYGNRFRTLSGEENYRPHCEWDDCARIFKDGAFPQKARGVRGVSTAHFFVHHCEYGKIPAGPNDAGQSECKCPLKTIQTNQGAVQVQTLESHDGTACLPPEKESCPNFQTRARDDTGGFARTCTDIDECFGTSGCVAGATCQNLNGVFPGRLCVCPPDRPYGNGFGAGANDNGGIPANYATGCSATPLSNFPTCTGGKAATANGACVDSSVVQIANACEKSQWGLNAEGTHCNIPSKSGSAAATTQCALNGECARLFAVVSVRYVRQVQTFDSAGVQSGFRLQEGMFANPANPFPPKRGDDDARVFVADCPYENYQPSGANTGEQTECALQCDATDIVADNANTDAATQVAPRFCLPRASAAGRCAAAGWNYHRENSGGTVIERCVFPAADAVFRNQADDSTSTGENACRLSDGGTGPRCETFFIAGDFARKDNNAGAQQFDFNCGPNAAPVPDGEGGTACKCDRGFTGTFAPGGGNANICQSFTFSCPQGESPLALRGPLSEMCAPDANNINRDARECVGQGWTFMDDDGNNATHSCSVPVKTPFAEAAPCVLGDGGTCQLAFGPDLSHLPRSRGPTDSRAFVYNCGTGAIPETQNELSATECQCATGHNSVRAVAPAVCVPNRVCVEANTENYDAPTDTCECNVGFRGDLCGEEFNPCQNGGTQVANDSEPANNDLKICECKGTGFRGKYCADALTPAAFANCDKAGWRIREDDSAGVVKACAFDEPAGQARLYDNEAGADVPNNECVIAKETGTDFGVQCATVFAATTPPYPDFPTLDADPETEQVFAFGDNRCMNGGVPVGQAGCDCAGTGYTGDACENDLNECEIAEGQPDAHTCDRDPAATCTNLSADAGRFECECPNGYTDTNNDGSQCDETLPEGGQRCIDAGWQFRGIDVFPHPNPKRVCRFVNAGGNQRGTARDLSETNPDINECVLAAGTSGLQSGEVLCETLFPDGGGVEYPATIPDAPSGAGDASVFVYNCPELTASDPADRSRCACADGYSEVNERLPADVSGQLCAPSGECGAGKIKIGATCFPSSGNFYPLPDGRADNQPLAEQIGDICENLGGRFTTPNAWWCVGLFAELPDAQCPIAFGGAELRPQSSCDALFQLVRGCNALNKPARDLTNRAITSNNIQADQGGVSLPVCGADCGQGMIAWGPRCLDPNNLPPPTRRVRIERVPAAAQLDIELRIGGTVITDPDGQKVITTDPVTLIATPRSAYYIASWLGDCGPSGKNAPTGEADSAPGLPKTCILNPGTGAINAGATSARAFDNCAAHKRVDGNRVDSCGPCEGELRDAGDDPDSGPCIALADCSGFPNSVAQGLQCVCDEANGFAGTPGQGAGCTTARTCANGGTLIRASNTCECVGDYATESDCARRPDCPANSARGTANADKCECDDGHRPRTPGPQSGTEIVCEEFDPDACLNGGSKLPNGSCLCVGTGHKGAQCETSGAVGRQQVDRQCEESGWIATGATGNTTTTSGGAFIVCQFPGKKISRPGRGVISNNECATRRASNDGGSGGSCGAWFGSAKTDINYALPLASEVGDNVTIFAACADGQVPAVDWSECVDSQTRNSCMNNGAFRPRGSRTGDSGVCMCPDGFSGANCETRIAPAVPSRQVSVIASSGGGSGSVVAAGAGAPAVAEGTAASVPNASAVTFTATPNGAQNYVAAWTGDCADAGATALGDGDSAGGIAKQCVLNSGTEPVDAGAVFEPVPDCAGENKAAGANFTRCGECLAGYDGGVSGSCAPCASNEFKAATGAESCRRCDGITSGAAGNGGPTVCEACVNGSRAGRDDNRCDCEYGWTGRLCGEVATRPVSVVASAGGGTVAAMFSGGQVSEGESTQAPITVAVTFTATPADGRYVSAWNGDCAPEANPSRADIGVAFRGGPAEARECVVSDGDSAVSVGATFSATLSQSEAQRVSAADVLDDCAAAGGTYYGPSNSDASITNKNRLALNPIAYCHFGDDSPRNCYSLTPDETVVEGDELFYQGADSGVINIASMCDSVHPPCDPSAGEMQSVDGNKLSGCEVDAESCKGVDENAKPSDDNSECVCGGPARLWNATRSACVAYCPPGEESENGACVPCAADEYNPAPGGKCAKCGSAGTRGRDGTTCDCDPGYAKGTTGECVVATPRLEMVSVSILNNTLTARPTSYHYVEEWVGVECRNGDEATGGPADFRAKTCVLSSPPDASATVGVVFTIPWHVLFGGRSGGKVVATLAVDGGVEVLHSWEVNSREYLFFKAIPNPGYRVMRWSGRSPRGLCADAPVSQDDEDTGPKICVVPPGTSAPSQPGEIPWEGNLEVEVDFRAVSGSSGAAGN